MHQKLKICHSFCECLHETTDRPHSFYSHTEANEVFQESHITTNNSCDFGDT